MAGGGPSTTTIVPGTEKKNVKKKHQGVVGKKRNWNKNDKEHAQSRWVPIQGERRWGKGYCPWGGGGHAGLRKGAVYCKKSLQLEHSPLE